LKGEFDMGKVKVKLKTPFGEIVVEGEDAEEILRMLENFPKNFMEKTVDLASMKLAPTATVRWACQEGEGEALED